MPDISVANLLISAGIAAATTVVIEFAAKPSLEVRKDRVLQRHRERQDLARRLIVIEADMRDASSAISMRGIDGVLPRIVSASDQLQSERVMLEDFLPRVLLRLMNWQLGYMAALIHSSLLVQRRMSSPPDSSDSAASDTTEELLGKFMESLSERWSALPAKYLRTSRWQLIRRFAIRREAERAIDANERDSPDDVHKDG